MKLRKALPLVGLTLVGAMFSCTQGKRDNRAFIDHGQLFDESIHESLLETDFEGHLNRISHAQLTSMNDSESSYILLVHEFGRSCTCWSHFAETCLLPFIKAHNLYIYAIDPSEFGGGAERYGLSVSSTEETVAIFSRGKLKDQKKVVDGSEFASHYITFANWMNSKVRMPSLLSVSKSQLEGLYQGENPFTVLFTRSTCQDCSYYTRNGLRKYLSKKETDSFYFIDCDVEGIRYSNGVGPNDTAEEGSDAKNAYIQWNDFKMRYGLAYSSANPAGWNEGYVPSLVHVNPIGDGTANGDVIDGMAVLYNDSSAMLITDHQYKVISTYYTEERLQLEALSYLRDSDLEHKVLTGLVLGNESDKHKAFAPYHDEIARVFLDTFAAK